MNQLKPYLELAKKLPVKVKTVRLDLPTGVLENRVAHPARKGDSLSVKSESELRKWIEENPMQPVKGEFVVDGERSVKEIARHIFQEVG